jgi:acetoacetate decarboxylase
VTRPCQRHNLGFQVIGGWRGPARLNLVPNANAPVAHFPMKKVLPGKHMIAHITLPYGRVLHDYLKEEHVGGLIGRFMMCPLSYSRQ